MATLKSLNFLPSIFRTETNRKFLGSTLDQMVTEPQLQKISGFVGRTFAPSWQKGDSYLVEPTATRQDYQLEPSVIIKNAAGQVQSTTTYPDLLNKLAYYNVPTENHSRLFENEYYNFDGLVDPDKFVNFYQYYWLPSGPDSVQISAIDVPLNETFEVSADAADDGVEIDKYGDQHNPTMTLIRGGSYTFITDDTVPKFWLQTEPGLSGFSSTLTTLPTREILGVAGNGAPSNGAISFTVPQSGAQDGFVNMPVAGAVNIATTLTYTQIADVPLSTVLAAGGLDGLQYFNNKTIIFATQTNADADWTSSQTSAIVPQNQRFGIWTVTVDNTNIVRLTFSAVIPVQNKVHILEGDVYANRYFYRAPNFAQTMVIVPIITANLDTLYYQTSNDANQVGVIRIVDSQALATIDVVNDILGRADYTSPNGVAFTNGLKVEFDGNVTPSQYQYTTQYVEGVGKSIALIPVQLFVTPETDAQDPDYITMNKNSQDLNAWSRSNRWFHVDVINSSAAYNNTSPLVDNASRAVRPIIEFEPNLQLFNSGSDFLSTVDLVDFTLTDAFSLVNGALGYHLDGIQLQAGMKVLFAGDTNPAISNNIYQVDLISLHSTGAQQINLTIAETAVAGDSIVATNGVNFKGISYYFNGTSWVQAQKKISINQPIKFDVFDDNGVSFGDTSIYPGSTFTGTNIFGYQIGDGAADSVLKFPLSYQVFNNVGDILFNDFYDTDSFSYLLDSVTTPKEVNDGFIHQNTETGYNIRNVWITANEPSKQYQNFTFTYVDTTAFVIDVQSESDLLVKNLLVYLNNNLLDSRVYTVELVDTPAITGTRITINATLTAADKVDVLVYSLSGSSTTGYYQIPNNLENNAQNAVVTSFTLGQYRKHVSNQFEYDTLAKGKFPGFALSTLAPDIIDTADTTLVDASNAILTSDNVSPYAQPTSLAAIFEGATANQVSTLFADTTEYDTSNTFITADEYFLQNYVTGGVGVTTQNLRDLPNIAEFPGTIIQNSAGLQYAELFLTNDNYNFVNAARLARQEYTNFKLKFLQASATVAGVDLLPTPQAVDAVMAYINSNKDSTFPYYYSDMVPNGTNNLKSVSYTVVNPVQMQYNMPIVFNDTVPSNQAITVYLNGAQLVKGVDYTFSQTTPIVNFTNTVTFNVNDQIGINYYSNTDGSWVPETPTKLGLYNKYTPQIITDNTYTTPIQVIVGHDGSNTPAFGDFRDNLLLELELRIFNNIKVTYDTNKLDYNSIIPGKFRTTDYSLAEVTQVLSTEFLAWAGGNKVDYIDNQWFVSDDFFTWNYSNFKDRDGDSLLGYWRGIYRYFYDTDHPDTRPWEMLGFSQMPLWWESTYGPAPYTNGNLVLWQDLANGYIAGGDTIGVNPQYIRPTLLNYIPVDDNGNLLAPAQSVSGGYDANLASENYVFGDDAPAENAWRYSSEYPYALQIMMALLKPARYFGLFIDSNYVKNVPLNQFIFNANKQRFTQADTEINGITINSQIERVASYTNWIADYMRSFGVNPQTTLFNDVTQMSIQLTYKMAGFSDQTYITPILEQSSPGSSSAGILVPVDNFSIPLIKSSPLATATYSAVIVEITGSGYSVSGYDFASPYFNIIPSNPTSNVSTITQTGVSVSIYQDYIPTVTPIAYGTTFTTKQQVVDFLVSYQRYLNALGFVFQQVADSLNQQQDWILSANEFLVWSQQGWSNGSAIVLSPGGTQLQVTFTNAVVDSIQNISTGSRVLDTNFKVIDSTRYTVLRDSSGGSNVAGFFQINTVDNTTIALLSVNLVQWEHVIVFDNITTFNDIIYQPETDERQYRIKLSGYKTGNWNGAINPPGFFINQNNVQEWQANATYKINELVQYKGVYYVAKKTVYPNPTFNYNYWEQIDYSVIKTGLIPNFTNTSTQYKNFYNVDYVNFNQQTDEFAKGLIGFRQRDYLSELNVESSSQLKFYQGFIAQKGTSTSIDAFTRAKFNNLDSSLDFFEEWALRVGTYGATNTSSAVEIQLDNSTFTGNPQIIVFANTDLVTQQNTNISSNEVAIPILNITPQELYKIPAGWDSDPFVTGIAANIDKQIETAGYIRTDDIDASVFDITNIENIGDIIPNIGSGYHIWTAKDYNNTWNVFRVTETNLHVINISNALDSLVQLEFDGYHSLNAGDIIAIKNFSPGFDGFYQVNSVVDLENVLVIFTGDLSQFIQVQGDGLLFKLNSVRFPTAADVSNFTPINGWLDNDLVWIDNYETPGQWSVLQKESTYTYDALIARSASTASGAFGTSIAVSTNGLYAVVGAPGPSVNGTTGSIVLYLKNLQRQFVSVEDINILSTNINGLGTAVTTMPNGFAVTAPKSNSSAGYVYIGTAATSLSSSISFNQVIVAPDSSPNSLFGQSICASADGFTLYIGSPGSNEVYYYTLITNAQPTVQPITVDGVTMSYQLNFMPTDPTSIFVSDTSSNVFINNIDYIVNGQLITFFVAPQNNILVTQSNNYYQYVSTIVAADSLPGDQFGTEIACNNDGSKVFIAAPQSNGLLSIAKSGSVYVFYRTQQALVGDGITTSFFATLPISTSNVMTLDGIVQDITEVTLIPSTNLVAFNTAPNAGSIITINYGSFAQVQKLSDQVPQVITNFGTSIAFDYLSGTLVIGSPNETINQVYYTGAVYRYVDTESVFGTISSTNVSAVVNNGDVISINDFFVSISGTTIQSVADSINGAQIPNISATVVNNIITINSTINAAYEKLKVLSIVGTTFSSLAFVEYVFNQKIGNPIPRSMSRFGTQLSISNGGEVLYVGNPYDVTYETTIIDAGKTTFDKSTTHYVDGIQSSGSVTIYDLLPGDSATDLGAYVEVQQLVSTNINIGDQFGSSIAVYEDSVFVGSPAAYDRNTNAGLVQEFQNVSGTPGWNVFRSKPATIAENAINKLFIYSKLSNSIVADIEYIDPICGRLPGEAAQNLDFITNYDPASYEYINQTADGLILNPNAIWGDKQVGMTWWDLDTVRFLEYHQGEDEYRAANWAATMPGSSVDVYEWVSSIYLPSQYVQFVNDGVPKFADNSTYTQKITYDSITGSEIISYYYWVKNKTSISVTSPKTLSVLAVAQILANPLSQGIVYAAILDTNAIALYNLTADIDSTNTILHITYSNAVDVVDTSIHNEYELIGEGSPNAKIPVKIINKLVDSLSGVDKLGSVVPDPKILISERFGINIRPRQSMIVNNLAAMESFVQFVNGVCADNQIALSKDLTLLKSSDPIPSPLAQDGSTNYNQSVPDYVTLTYIDIINLPVGYMILVESDFNFNGNWVIYTLTVQGTWAATRMESYNTNNYWEYVTWYSPDYVSGILPKYTVATQYDLLTLQNLVVGDIIQVNDNGTGNSETVSYNGSTFDLLSLQNGTIQFNTNLYNYVDNGFGFDNERFDVQPYEEYPVQETRNVINAVLNDIFINDLVIEFNSLFFVLVNYILSEQKYVDWIFKTSFVSILQQIRELTQTPLYQPDNQTYLESYINEVKPYHTQIRQYILDYVYQENYMGDVTDFDLPAYYDNQLGRFRSPDGTLTSDALLLETAPQYRDWYDNYQSKQLLSITVTNGGTNYAVVPKVVVMGGGGLGATAIASINGSGQVTAITIQFGGSNFSTAPTVVIEGGGGTGATAFATIGNNLIRSIKTIIKFDRITFDTAVVNWAPNTAFTTSQIIRFNNVGYAANTNFTSGTTFDATNLTQMDGDDYTNANDRIMALYQPTSGMPGLDLDQLQSGITFPGVMIDALRFEETPLFDLDAFDVHPFDATVIGPEGFPEPADIMYDASYSSLYTDTALGVRPEDIITDGGPFLGGFPSFAPEELIAVSNYDTLDFKVMTLDPTISPFDVKGIPIDSIVYSTDGVITSFPYGVGNSLLGDNIIVFSKNTGAKTVNVQYYVDYNNKVVHFFTAPTAGDDVIIFVIDDAGAGQIFAGEFILNSTSTHQIFIEAPFEQIQDSLVLYNGAVTAAYTLSLAPDNRNTILSIDGTLIPKVNGLNVHVHLYNRMLTHSDLHVQTITLPGTITSGDYTINLERTVYDVGPWGGQIIVQLDNNRLEPVNTAYYTGDGSTTIFASSSTIAIDPTTVNPADFDIWVDGHVQFLGSNYTVLAPSGMLPRAIQFTVPPANGSQVSIGLSTLAQYTFNSGSQIQLNQSSVILHPHRIIRITTFSNQDTLGIRTMVFEGGQVISTQELLGFSAEGFDTSGFDSTVTVELVEPVYTLSRPVYNMNYLVVTYNGRRLYSNFDYVMQTPTQLRISGIAIQPTDIIIVTSFTETVQQSPMGFRMFKDMNDNWSYLRMSAANSTTLARPLAVTDTQIYVLNSSALSIPNPSTVTPGVIFIGGERITYWTIDNTNKILGQIRRGTLGTSVTQATIPIGAVVEDASVVQEIPNAAGVTWYDLGSGTPSDGNSLINATTIQANFLREEPSFYIG